jgi:hypothetical protein
MIMKTLCLILVVVVCPLFVFSQSSSTKKYFEGIVEYEIKGESYMQGVSDNELRERIGASLRLYFKNGTYMREYVDGAGYTLRKLFYLKDKNMMYDYNPIASPDTVYVVDPTEAAYVSYKIEQGKPETVLNYKCPAAVISAKYCFPPVQDTGNVIMTYYFSPELPVDPEWHKDFYVWKDVIKEYKSIAIKFIEDDPFFFKQTFTATRILWQPVPDEVFVIDPKLVQVKAPK